MPHVVRYMLFLRFAENFYSELGGPFYLTAAFCDFHDYIQGTAWEAPRSNSLPLPSMFLRFSSQSCRPI